MIMKIFCAMALMHTIINRRICILMGFVWCFTIKMFQYRALCLAYTHIGMEIVLSGLVMVCVCVVLFQAKAIEYLNYKHVRFSQVINFNFVNFV